MVATDAMVMAAPTAHTVAMEAMEVIATAIMAIKKIILLRDKVKHQL